MHASRAIVRPPSEGQPACTSSRMILPKYSTITTRPIFHTDDDPGEFRLIHRVESSADFLIDGTSLLETLFVRMGDRYDLCGCFMYGYPNLWNESLSELLCTTQPSLESGRVALYVSRCCAEIGCGGFAARVRRTKRGFIWSDFAYESASSPPRRCQTSPMFHFDALEYQASLSQFSPT
jgi:hypothetical protein